MSAVLDSRRNASACSHVAEGGGHSVLRRISEPELNLCVWQRAANPAAEPALRKILATESTFGIDLRAPAPEQITAEIVTVLGDRDESVICSLRHLVSDISLLADLFADTTGTVTPRVRLERVDDDGCALFHADSLRLRLLCTYAGPGTQWLENENVRRDQLGSRGREIDEANRAIVRDESAIRTIPRWHAAIFKGRAWPDHNENALIHRSAPVREQSAFRVRLCIDLPHASGC